MECSRLKNLNHRLYHKVFFVKLPCLLLGYNVQLNHMIDIDYKQTQNIIEYSLNSDKN